MILTYDYITNKIQEVEIEVERFKEDWFMSGSVSYGGDCNYRKRNDGFWYQEWLYNKSQHIEEKKYNSEHEAMLSWLKRIHSEKFSTIQRYENNKVKNIVNILLIISKNENTSLLSYRDILCRISSVNNLPCIIPIYGPSIIAENLGFKEYSYGCYCQLLQDINFKEIIPVKHIKYDCDMLYITASQDGTVRYYYDEKGPLSGYDKEAFSDYFKLYEINKKAYNGQYLPMDAKFVKIHTGSTKTI